MKTSLHQFCLLFTSVLLYNHEIRVGTKDNDSHFVDDNRGKENLHSLIWSTELVPDVSTSVS